jgi:hypothetical protein
VDGATEYIVDEATDVGFGTAAPRTVTTITAAYSHAATAETRYFYRVRARSHIGSCDLSSSPSSTTSVLVTIVVIPAMRVLPVVGSTAGLSGSFFKTTLQMYNPKAVSISGKIVFHAQGIPGVAADPSLAYSILPGKTLSLDDLLPAMGVASGMGSADLIADATSTVPVALMRVFNDAGPLGTTGFAMEAATTDEALKQGSSGALLMPADMNKFRVNIGVRTLDQGVSMVVTIRDRDGATSKTLSKTLSPTYFRQTSSFEFLEGFTLAGGETISFAITSGSAFVYGATTDNVTNDPSMQLARRID